jgi:hypothetical protein
MLLKAKKVKVAKLQTKKCYKIYRERDGCGGKEELKEMLQKGYNYTCNVFSLNVSIFKFFASVLSTT